MSTNPSETLKILFDIETGVINRDLQRAQDDISAIGNELASLFKLRPAAGNTPETDARVAHLLMIQASELCRREAVPPELATFHAAFAAEHIAGDAERLSSDKRTCAELCSRMDAICRREGLAEGEFWAMQHEGPQDYRELSDEFGRVLSRVHDTVFSFALSRYHLHEHAKLFEQDPVEFEIRREIGRRATWPPDKAIEDVEKLIDDHIRTKYGADVLQRVKSRAKELRKGG